jgi:hypothetical protein
VSIWNEFLYFETGRTMIEDIKLEAGLAVIRYKSIGKKGNAVITADIPPSSRGNLTLLTDPTAPDDVLAAPGDCWVVQCRRPSVISLNIESSQPGAAARGSVVVEYLSDQTGQKRRESRAEVRSRNERLATNRQKTFSAHEASKIMAHVANQGDIYAEPGDWLRGDGHNDAIEGLCMPAFGYSRIILRDLNSNQIAEPGMYLGSRGQFRSLGGLEMWLENADGAEEICAEALFEEAGLREASGTSVALVGADDQDSLIGLKVWLQKKRGSSRVASGSSQRSGAENNQTGRIKVFRK